MQRSPLRKCTRSQSASSQNNTGSSSAGTYLSSQQLAPTAAGAPLLPASSSAARTATPVVPLAPGETNASKNRANISEQIISVSAADVALTGSTAAGTSSDVATTSIAASNMTTDMVQRNQQNFGEKICVSTRQQQLPQTNPAINLEGLQSQINALQVQLLTAQKVLSIAINGNLSSSPDMPQPSNMAPAAAVTNVENSASANVDCAGRRTPFSCVSCNANNSGFYASQPPLAQMLPPNSVVSQNSGSVAVHRKIYDLPEFSGTPEEWPMFSTAFNNSTAVYSYNNFENCLRLQKALKGEARECVKSLLIHPENVPTVIEQLKFQYGRPELLIRYQLQQVKDIQPIGENHIDKLVPFSIKVRNLAAFLETANGEQHLSNPTLMEELVQKLPMSKRLDWAQFASALNRWPTVLDLSTWLQSVANLVRSVQVSSSSGNRMNNESKRKVLLHTTDGQENKLKCFYCLEPHKIFECGKFLELNVPSRWTEVKRLKLCFSCLGNGHSSKDCRRSKKCCYENCQRKHNKLLHEDKPSIRGEVSASVPSRESRSTVEPVLSCVSSVRESSNLLFRVLPVILYGPSCSVETYALLDEGSSVTMMDSSLVRQLGLPGHKSNLSLSWYGGKSAREPAVAVDLHISGVNKKRKYVLKNVYGVANLNLPSQSFNAELLKGRGIPIRSYECVAPKLLIGLDHCHLGLPDEIVPLEDAGPYAVNTPLGWIVFGNMTEGRPGTRTCLLTTRMDNLNNMVANYFETENFGVKALPVVESKDDLRARDILKKSTKRLAGRFESRLLWSSDDVVLPDSYSMALNRLYGLERKMRNNPEFGEAYKKIMNEYVEKGYVRKLPLSQIGSAHPRTWYLPHFGVVNPNKPGKIRLVFDAAAKVEEVSLNSKLLKGPQEYKPLPTVLFNFRTGSVAVCGDIKEMFHQIVVAKEDRCSQRYLWRQDDSGPPEVYEMLVMTFGAACSPCIAHYVKETNALEYKDRYPRAVKSILDHHYVDDFVDSFEDSSKAIDVALQVREIHKAAGFEMRNFTSNSPDVVVALEGNQDHPVSFSGSLNELEAPTEKVLGMFWDPADDAFKFILKFHRVNTDVIDGKRCPTKRELLSVVMSIFDPIGFLCHFMITAKLLLREVWRRGILWDEKLPESLQAMWNNWRQELRNVVKVKIQRFYFRNGLPINLELHIFVDASEDAFGAVAYWRYTTSDGGVGVSFISAKTKCAPMKSITIPRLELQAAVLGTRLMCTVMKEHELHISRRICWSDSTTVIKWIGSESRRYKPFVAHRISEILDSTRPDDWRWLPTDFNVADDTTRVKNQIDFSMDSRWFQGPHFLYQHENDWPKSDFGVQDVACEEELRSKFALLVSTNLVIDFNRFSSFLRLKRTMAWVMRFIHGCKKLRNNGSKCLMTEELKNAEVLLCRLSQQESFAYEIDVLRSGGILNKNNDLFKLSPYVDENKLLRVSGRIDAASWLPLDARRPIILSPTHRFTQLLVANVHDKMRHQNFEATIGEIRKRFWVPRLRKVLKETTSKCNLCRIRRAAPVPPLMGPLPIDRLTPYVRPFTYTGVDYFGPINITIGRRHEKRWVALFTCLTIRAVHLEVAFDLSTDACILAIRNFINRRGTPLKIRSDNGKNFVGANQEAKRFEEAFDVVRIQDELSTKGIDWEFNCPCNPAEGGIWERMVQCVKKVLRVALKEVAPREHTLVSFLIEAENIVNSRPLTHLPVSPDDEEPLTPNHFLLGYANTAQTPKGTEIEKPIVTKKQWRISRQMRDHFWKRWIIEYLPTLTRRSKWCEYTKPVAPGDLVLICDPAVSRRDWRRGRVITVFPGNDGVVRRADVQTSSGVLRRPISKLAVLDLE